MVIIHRVLAGHATTADIRLIIVYRQAGDGE